MTTKIREFAQLTTANSATTAKRVYRLGKWTNSTSTPAKYTGIEIGDATVKAKVRSFRIGDLRPGNSWRVFQDLNKMRALDEGWDAYDAPAPNEQSILTARQLLEKLFYCGFAPTAVVPSGDGGVAVTFRKRDRYASIEACNDGDIVAMTGVDDGEEPHIWMVDPSNRNKSLFRIREFIEQPNPKTTASERASSRQRFFGRPGAAISLLQSIGSD